MRETEEQRRLIESAQRKIAGILQQLEADTQMLVKDISVRSIDLTSLSGFRSEYQQSVEIEMYRLPGHNW